MKVRFRHRTDFGPDERNHSVNERNAVTWRQKTPQLRPRCFPASELRKLGFAFILKTEAQGALTRVTPPSLVSRRGISECLPRLTCMVRGIGDPLVAVYARAYLCRVGRGAPPARERGRVLPPLVCSRLLRHLMSHQRQACVGCQF